MSSVDFGSPQNISSSGERFHFVKYKGLLSCLVLKQLLFLLSAPDDPPKRLSVITDISKTTPINISWTPFPNEIGVWKYEASEGRYHIYYGEMSRNDTFRLERKIVNITNATFTLSKDSLNISSCMMYFQVSAESYEEGPKSKKQCVLVIKSGTCFLCLSREEKKHLF